MVLYTLFIYKYTPMIHTYAVVTCKPRVLVHSSIVSIISLVVHDQLVVHKVETV